MVDHNPLQCKKLFLFDLDGTLYLGDRLYTDISSGANAGIDTLLVLSGETKEGDLPTADPQPTFVLPDVAALLNILES